MNATEVVVREKEAQRGSQVPQLARKPIGQSRKPANLHPDGQIVSFYVRRADAIAVGPTADFGNVHARDLRRAVAARSGILGCVTLLDLRVVQAVPPIEHFDSIHIVTQAVGTELVALRTALAAVRAGGHDLTAFLKFGLKGIAIQTQRLTSLVRNAVSKELFRGLMVDLYALLCVAEGCDLRNSEGH